MMQLWKYLIDFFFGNEPLPEAIATLLVKIVAKPQEVDHVQHLNRCLELDQPIIIHYLSKIEEDE